MYFVDEWLTSECNERTTESLDQLQTQSDLRASLSGQCSSQIRLHTYTHTEDCCWVTLSAYLRTPIFKLHIINMYLLEGIPTRSRNSSYTKQHYSLCFHWQLNYLFTKVKYLLCFPRLPWSLFFCKQKHMNDKNTKDAKDWECE